MDRCLWSIVSPTKMATLSGYGSAIGLVAAATARMGANPQGGPKALARKEVLVWGTLFYRWQVEYLISTEI
jgi:hypothetical protein